MRLMSSSFREGEAIPGEFCFAVVDQVNHVSLSKNRNPQLALERGAGGDEVVCADLS